MTSGEDSAAQNFGLDELPPREQRYAMADEYVELVCRLFDSWGPDAVVMDRATGTYADYTKVNPVNFKGKFFKCRGPAKYGALAPGPPRRSCRRAVPPAAVNSPARTADSIIATANGHAGMKAYRDDVRARAAAAGRNPDDIKVLFLIYPCIGETTEEAWAKYRRLVNGPAFIEAALAAIGTVTDIDFSQFDLDQPLPHLTTNGEQGSLDKFAQWGSGKTLRQLASERYDGGLQLVGTPDEVAEKMGAAMEAIGGDGFLVSTPFQRSSRRVVVEITEGLVPALQRRGLVRTAYQGTTLREVLQEF